jgi:hypothetical protein
MLLMAVVNVNTISFNYYFIIFDEFIVFSYLNYLLVLFRLDGEDVSEKSYDETKVLQSFHAFLNAICSYFLLKRLYWEPRPNLDSNFLSGLIFIKFLSVFFYLKFPSVILLYRVL